VPCRLILMRVSKATQGREIVYQSNPEGPLRAVCAISRPSSPDVFSPERGGRRRQSSSSSSDRIQRIRCLAGGWPGPSMSNYRNVSRISKIGLAEEEGGKECQSTRKKGVKEKAVWDRALMMSGKRWHSGGRRSVGDDRSQISAIAKGAAFEAKDARRVMPGRATKGLRRTVGTTAPAVQRLTWGCINRRFLF